MRSMTRAHDAIIKRVRALGKASDAKRIAGAFVASLGEAPGFWRAPLMALAVAERVPAHVYTPWSKGDGQCRVCGLDPEAEVESPHERGQLLPEDLAGVVAALEQAKQRKGEAPKPSATDVKRLQRIFAMVGELPASAREGKLNEAMRAEKLVAGEKYDRRHVIETLGACSVLETAEHPGFTTAWTSFAARQARPTVRVECDPPIAFWSAGHGVGAAGVERWFGHLGVTAPRVSATRAAEQAKVTEAAAVRQSKLDRRAARATELVVGDAVAFAVGARWIAGIVVDHFQDRGGRRPVVELVQWAGDAPPAVEVLHGRGAAGTRSGKNQCRGRLILSDLWKRTDRRRRWVVVGEGMKAPASGHLGEAIGVGSFRRMIEIDRIARDAGLVDG